MKILCVSSSFDNKTLYNLARLILGNKIKKDVSPRKMEIIAEHNNEDISIQFMVHQQDIKQFQCMRPNLLILHGSIPKHLEEFVASVGVTGGLVMKL